jgi:hypothetical protein
MTVEIKNKIIGYEVISNDSVIAEEEKQEKTEDTVSEKGKETAEIIQMHEKLERPDMLLIR